MHWMLCWGNLLFTAASMLQKSSCILLLSNLCACFYCFISLKFLRRDLAYKLESGSVCTPVDITHFYMKGQQTVRSNMSVYGSLTIGSYGDKPS